MAFTRTWNAAYKALPEDDDESREGASHIRNTRVDIAERMEVDHYWGGDADDGKHKKVTLKPQSADPTLGTDEVALYGKTVSGKTELHWKNEDGGVVQLTFTGISQFLPPGCIVPFAGLVEPTGYLLCYGQAVSRTTYAALFNAIGTTYGIGDGSTTFNLPDLRGRVVAGLDNMGGASANRLTNQSGGLNGDVLGATGGSETHTLVLAEIPAHSHTVNDPGHSHQYTTKGGTAPQSGSATQCWVNEALTNTNSAFTGITLQNSGGGGAHNNVQPTFILKYIIKT